MTKCIENKEQKGLELYFDIKPSAKILEQLKANHWRWNMNKKCWWAKDSEQNRHFAESFVEYSLAEYVQEENKEKEEPVNEFGIKVGDVFYASWGYDQTNIDFYQVMELRGKKSVLIKGICLKVKEEEAQSWGSRDVSHHLPTKLAVPLSYAPFIKDNEKGMLKRVSGTKEQPYLNMSSFANAYLYRGEKLYESWYA